MHRTQFKLTTDSTNTITVKEELHKIGISVFFPWPSKHA